MDGWKDAGSHIAGEHGPTRRDVLRLGAFGSLSPLAAALSGTEPRQEVRPDAVINPEDLDLERVAGVFDRIDLRAEHNDGKSFHVREGGITTHVTLDRDLRTITLISVWSLRSRFSEGEKVRLANRLNDKSRMVRFCIPRPETLWCDYLLLYDGGIKAAQIINAYRQFVNVCRATIARHDPDDIIGRD
jgi:hypothetical protein